MNCKKCNTEFHCCNCCSRTVEQHYGYCSTTCLEQGEELTEIKTNLNLLLTNLPKDYIELFKDFLDNYDESLHYFYKRIIDEFKTNINETN